TRGIEERRERTRAALREPTSTLAAVARHELPVGTALRFGPGDVADVRLDDMPRDVVIRAVADGFEIDGEPSPPRSVEAGRYVLRLSHQNYPAVVVLDAKSPRLTEDVERRWFPVDPAMRFRAKLHPDRAVGSIGSTASGDRAVERIGWVDLVIAGERVRLAVTRLLEPGSHDQLDIYFRDATTGSESYEVGRYVDVERSEHADEVIVDFNLAYNPSCALSPFYNCPIPPLENRLAVPIRAGEMSPITRSRAAHD
ncbi:MAG TPA: DUF1684 domain-containing protein, partial [Candidatus Limnocylindrales bacterium]|nr:DUF1684 domain-containing protein [Candidatus Limnocylindrales bacterium]